MWKRVMVPLDGSLFAECALDAARAIAPAAELHIVRVRELFLGACVPDTECDEVQVREARRCLVRGAELTARRHQGRVRTEYLVGDVGPELCAYAARHAVDLVVMTSHGRTGLSRALRGSVADHVIRHASAPVLLLPSHGARRAVVDASSIGLVVAALDGSASSAQLLPHAAELALALRVPLQLLRVVAPLIERVQMPDERGRLPARRERVSRTGEVVEQAEQDLAEIAEALRRSHPALVVERHVRVSKHVPAALVSAAHERRHAILALASHGRGASRVLMGSVADALLREADVSLLVVRHQVPHDADTVGSDAPRRHVHA